MVIRLLLALVLAFGALPMAAPCHAAPASHCTKGIAHHPQPPANQAPAEHGCIGCAALDDWLAERVAAPSPPAAIRPVALPSRMALGAAAPPMLRPPRIG